MLKIIIVVTASKNNWRVLVNRDLMKKASFYLKQVPAKATALNIPENDVNILWNINNELDGNRISAQALVGKTEDTVFSNVNGSNLRIGMREFVGAIAKAYKLQSMIDIDVDVLVCEMTE